jgi:hypothetical protein
MDTEHVGDAVEDAVCPFGFTDRRQAAGAQGVGRVPGAGRVDHRACLQLQVRPWCKARITKGADSRPALFTLSKPSRVTAITFVDSRSAETTCGSCAKGSSTRCTTSPASGSSIRLGRLPAGRFEQPGHRRVDVVAPGREQPHVAVVEQAGADRRRGFQDEERDAAVDQLGGRGEADRAGAEHGDRQAFEPGRMGDLERQHHEVGAGRAGTLELCRRRQRDRRRRTVCHLEAEAFEPAAGGGRQQRDAIPATASPAPRPARRPPWPGRTRVQAEQRDRHRHRQLEEVRWCRSGRRGPATFVRQLQQLRAGP